MLDALTREAWVAQARAGSPPPPDAVAEHQFGLQSPWHIRKHFYPILRAINPAERSKKFLFGREVSRGHGKSVLSRFLAIYAAEYVIPHIDCRDENRLITFIGREAKKHVAGRIMKALNVDISRFAPWLKTPNWADLTFEEVRDLRVKGRTWGESRFELTNGVTITGASISQSGRGDHGYLAIVDDLVDENNFLESDEMMATINDGIMPTIEFGGVVLTLGTPQCQGDVYDLIANDPKWDYVSLPAVDKTGTYAAENKAAIKLGLLPESAITESEDLNCLWPSRFSHSALMFERGQTPASILSFDREYLLQRNSEAGSLVTADDMTRAKDTSLAYEQSGTYGHRYYGGGDPSSLAQSDAACVIGIVDKDSNRIPLLVRRLEAKSIKVDPEIAVMEMFSEVSSAFNHPNLLIEANQFQGSIGPVMRRMDAFANVTRYTLGAQKHTDSGWLMVRTLFRNGRVRLPYGPTPEEAAQIAAGHLTLAECHAVKTTDLLCDQLRKVAYIDNKVITQKGAKDDLVSALFLFFKATENVVQGNYLGTAPTPSASAGFRARDNNRRRGGELAHNNPATDRLTAARRLERMLDDRRSSW